MRENQLKLNLGVGGMSRNMRKKRQRCLTQNSVAGWEAEKDPKKTPARPLTEKRRTFLEAALNV